MPMMASTTPVTASAPPLPLIIAALSLFRPALLSGVCRRGTCRDNNTTECVNQALCLHAFDNKSSLCVCKPPLPHAETKGQDEEVMHAPPPPSTL